MRQTKFRGLTENGHWVYGDLIQTKPNKVDGGFICWIKEQDFLGLGAVSTSTDSFSKVRTETVGQFTGLKDVNGVEIYEGDILNIYYTSSHYGDTYNHDGIYIAVTGALGDLVFKFKRLLWDNYGHNQFPFNSTLSQEFESLSYRYSDELGKNELLAPDGSNYFEVIGNVHKNPELLEQNDE